MVVDWNSDSRADHRDRIALTNEEIRIENVVYLRTFADPQQSDTDRWVKVNRSDASAETLHRSEDIAANEPLKELEKLRVVSSQFHKVSEQQVHGSEVSHYRGSVESGSFDGTWDLWIQDELIRTFRFEHVKQQIIVTTKFYDFGTNAKIAPPPSHLVSEIGTTPAASECRFPGEPITVDLAMKTLGKHGFSVFRDPGSTTCEGSEDQHVLADLTNVLFRGPHQNTDSHAGIRRREGHLICTVRPRPIYGSQSKITWGVEDGGPTDLTLANVECSLYPDSEERRTPQVAKLVKALRELQTVVEP